MFKSIDELRGHKKGSLEGKISGAVVVNNNDPKQLCRVLVRIPSLQTGRPDSDLSWAMPLGFSMQGNTSGGVGDVGIPVIGAKVAVYFPEDDEHNIYYLGDYHDNTTLPAELLADYPNTNGRVDRAGNLWIINTTQNTAAFYHVTGSYYKFAANGDVEIGSAHNLIFYANNEVSFRSASGMSFDATSITNNGGGSPSLTITPRTPPTATPFSEQKDY